MENNNSSPTSDTPITEISTRLQHVKQQITDACLLAKRDPNEVKLLLAAKYQSSEAITQAVYAGANLFGHNIVQQMVAGGPHLKSLSASFPVETHLIGHLQSNKINATLKWATCVQTLDSMSLAEKISAAVLRMCEQTGGIGPKQDRKYLEVMIQVNTSNENSKSGCHPDEALSLAKLVADLPALHLTGFMTIGALHPDPEVVRNSLRSIRLIRDQVLASKYPGTGQATQLSMGMTNDLPIAIAEGSTLVRIGTAVFGPRATQTYQNLTHH